MRTVLALDVGNSRVKMGLFVNGQIEERLQVQTPEAHDVALLVEKLGTAFDRWKHLDACLIACVVRGLQDPLIEAVQRVWEVSPVVVNTQYDLGIRVAVPKPEGVGIDRLLEASAAFHVVQSGVVVVAFGSAITIDLVTDDGVFQGGTILPGLRTGLRALHQMTSLLPQLEVKDTESVLGKDTAACMQAGVIYGAAGAVDRIYEELCAVANKPLPLVLTGGDVRFVARLLRSEYQLEADLVLRGLVLVDGR